MKIIKEFYKSGKLRTIKYYKNGKLMMKKRYYERNEKLIDIWKREEDADCVIKDESE